MGAENKYHRMGKLVCFENRERDPSYYLIHGPLVVSVAVSASYSSNWKGRERKSFLLMRETGNVLSQKSCITRVEAAAAAARVVEVMKWQEDGEEHSG